ncbi:MAG: response regulator, partial [Clostridia bacterium]|nr:response regulator [Clostridia bacterium]
MSKRIRVLLADNNKELCHVLTEHIKQHEDLELTGIAYDGLEAVEMVKKDDPDVLVLDISMPYLDGIGVMERLNELETRPRVIVLTAFEQESMVQRMINMGADYYIVKPFDTAILLDRIRQFGHYSGKASDSKGLYRPGDGYTITKDSTKVNLEMEITKLFHEMGIPA